MATHPTLRKIMSQAKCANAEFAEKEFALTHILQALHEKGALEEVAFKGGTCIRKTLSGPSARLSTDLDFTSLSNKPVAEDIVINFHEICQTPFHGFSFHTDLENGWYMTGGGESVGFGIEYEHAAMGLAGEIRIQVSMRALPILDIVRKPQVKQDYFKSLAFQPCDLRRLRAEEMLAEKVRALCQREKTRDLYDLHWFSTIPHNHDLARKLVVLKLWESSDAFKPDKFFSRLTPEMGWDWDDLASLVRTFTPREGERMLKKCSHVFSFFAKLSSDEQTLSEDRHMRLTSVANDMKQKAKSLAGPDEGREWDNVWNRREIAR